MWSKFCQLLIAPLKYLPKDFKIFAKVAKIAKSGHTASVGRSEKDQIQFSFFNAELFFSFKNETNTIRYFNWRSNKL